MRNRRSASQGTVVFFSLLAEPGFKECQVVFQPDGVGESEQLLLHGRNIDAALGIAERLENSNEALDPEHFTVGVVNLNRAIAEQQERVFRRKLGRYRVV